MLLGSVWERATARNIKLFVLIKKMQIGETDAENGYNRKKVMK